MPLSRYHAYAALAVLSGLLFALSLYSFVFFAWVTATPISETDLERAKTLATCWGMAALVSPVFVMITAIAAIRARRSASPRA